MSWTHTVEERLQRLEQRQERLQARMSALAGGPAVERKPGDGAPPAVGPAGGGAGPAGAGAAPARARVVDPGLVPAEQPVRFSPRPGGRWVAQPEGREAPAPAAPQPIGGGQLPNRPALGMWVPARGTGAQLLQRDRRLGIKQRMDALTENARTLSAAVQRLETMVTLLGQVVTVALDPNARLELPAGSVAGGGDGGGLSGLLGLLGGHSAGSGAAGAGSGDGAEAGAGGDGGSPGEVRLTGNEGLAAVVPLLQQLLAQPGQGRGAANVSAVLGSPAFQQILALLRR